MPSGLPATPVLASLNGRTFAIHNRRPHPAASFHDLVVVELGHSVAAPFAGQILGDLGADVIKVEKRGGDDARKWGPPFWEGAAASFQTLNRNKRSVVCDLRAAGDGVEAGRSAAMRLIVMNLA